MECLVLQMPLEWGRDVTPQANAVAERVIRENCRIMVKEGLGGKTF
jgi:hypothetical protein